MVNTGQQGGRYGVKQLQNDILGSTNQYIKAETAWIVVLAPIGDYPSTAPVFEENEKMYPPVELPYGRDTTMSLMDYHNIFKLSDDEVTHGSGSYYVSSGQKEGYKMFDDTNSIDWTMRR